MQQFLREVGIRTQAIPEQLELVDVVPRNPSGKIMKGALRDRYRGAAFVR
jgi:cyclohexanecarboxylate-CoA ligase